VSHIKCLIFDSQSLIVKCYGLTGVLRSYAASIPASPVMNSVLRKIGGIGFTDQGVLNRVTIHHSTTLLVWCCLLFWPLPACCNLPWILFHRLETCAPLRLSSSTCTKPTNSSTYHSFSTCSDDSDNFCHTTTVGPSSSVQNFRSPRAADWKKGQSDLVA